MSLVMPETLTPAGTTAALSGTGPSRGRGGPELERDERIRQVDQAVRAVVAALQRAPEPGPSRAAGEARGGGSGHGQAFAGRLLGERHVASLPAGILELRLEPGTVVTPLAQAGLKQRGIALRWVSAHDLARAGLTGEWALAVTHDAPLALALRRSLLADGQDWHDRGDDARDVARWVGSAASHAAIVVTPQAALVTWQACQVVGVRAAVAATPEAALAAFQQIGANLLAIEPTGLSIYSMKHLCAFYRRLGVPAPPAPVTGGVR
jgi:hypothetical protein